MTRFRYHIIVLLILANSLLFWYINLRIVSVDRIEVPGTGLQHALRDMVIVHISDLHIDRVGCYQKSAAGMINKIEPDLILITGDMLKYDASVDEAAEFVSYLKSRFGIIMAPGNYDYHNEISGRPKALFNALKQEGVIVLRNKCLLGRVIRDGYETSRFYLAGMDDEVTFHNDLDLTLSGTEHDIPVLLMSHTPIILDHAAEKCVNMIISGHTHGGQIYIPYLTRKLTESYFIGSYMKGLHSEGNTKIFINRGIGTSLIPVRFLSRPQIAILKFI